ncbi:MAG TPA: sialidase family protein [Gemmatimonadales bacterium]
MKRLLFVVVCLAGLACERSGGMRIIALKAPSAGAPQSADPALAVDLGSGDLLLAWAEGDGHVWTLYHTRSGDGGTRWLPPVRVAGGAGSPEEVHPHGESSPRLVAGPGQRIALVWPNSITVPGRKWPAAMLRFSRSVDGGVTWSIPLTLNDDTTGALASHQFHGAAWVGDSGLAVAWLDERGVMAPTPSGVDGGAEQSAEPDATIYLASSPDFGRSWTPNRIGWTAACPCCRVSLARNADGQAVAAWRQHFPGNIRDVVTAKVGNPPSKPERVHPDNWSYAGCPHTGPALATAGDGAAHVVWYNGKAGSQGMYYARSGQPGGRAEAVELVSGARVGPSHPAVVALSDGGALAAYDVTASGERRIGVARLRADGSLAGRVWVDDSDGGKYPQLAVLGDTLAVVSWTGAKGDSPQLRMARISLFR